ncbi:hypothetical protein Tco_1455451 [Tanacetum coccineum]
MRIERIAKVELAVYGVGQRGKVMGLLVEAGVEVNVLVSNFNHGSTLCKISMLHVPPKNYDIEGEIIPCSDFLLGTSQPRLA